MTKNQKTRACNILFVQALKCADFVSRESLEDIIRNSVYASTVNKTMGYVNDLKFYHNARFEYKKNNKTVTHVKMLNVHEFNHETGFPLTQEESAQRAKQLADFCLNLAALDNEVTMSEESFIVSADETVATDETVTENVTMSETLVMTSDNDIVMSDESLSVDESAIVARNEKRREFAAKMQAAKAAKKAAKAA